MAAKNDIDFLIFEYLDGSISKEGQSELKMWLEGSSENLNYFTKTCSLWEVSGSIKNTNKFDSVKGWKSFVYQINPGLKVRHLLTRIGKVAAILVFAFIASYSILKIESKQSITKNLIVNEAPLGSKSKVTLPDGSKVWINAGSTLKYPGEFNQNNRDVILEGEAYFEVESDKRRPFDVIASGIKVEATGTQFNVRAYNDENFIEATLVEGVVSVSIIEEKNGDELVLTPNQKIRISKNQSANGFGKVVIKSNVSTALFTSWKDNQWVFENESLASLAVKLERRYDLKIEILDKRIEKIGYTGTLPDETFEQVINAISKTTPVHYKIKGKNVTIWYNKEFLNKEI